MGRDKSRPDSVRAFALFALECFDHHRSEFDPVNGAPRMNISFENLNSVESCILKGCEKAFFSERAGNAAAPKLRIILHLLWHVFITDNVADTGATTFFEHAEACFEQPPFQFRFYEAE